MASGVLYVHVADDGGVLVIDGETGRSSWVVVSDLVGRLEMIRDVGGSELVSTEEGSAVANPVLELVRGAGVPIGPSREVHPDSVRSGGATVLMSAAYVGADEIVLDLIERGAPLDARDTEGFTALTYAANAGQDGIVKLLVDAGAQVDATDNEGSTALMFAAQHGYAGVVKRLVVSGADVTAKRIDGLSAHDFATHNGHERVAAILLSAADQVS